MTHYEVLGVAPDAAPEEVRRAYLRLARRHHPDFHAADGPGHADAERDMRRINEAWAVLRDPRARLDYDRAQRAERQAAWTPGTVSPDFVPFDDGEDPEDPAAEHDIPYGDGSPVHRSMQVGPVVLLAVALGALGLGGLLDVRPLLALGVAGLVGAALAFVATPVYAILRSHQHTRE